MKTFDGISLIQKHLRTSVGSYPEGSLSPRTVMLELPIQGDQEEFFNKVNQTITTALGKHAVDFMKNYKPAAKGFTAVSDLKTKEDPNVEIKKLEATVMNALKDIE